MEKLTTKSHFNEYTELLNDFTVPPNLDDENDLKDLQTFTKKLYTNCLEKYQKKCIFIWRTNEIEFSDILVKSILDNDFITERHVSRISLLNVALFCGSITRARDP